MDTQVKVLSPDFSDQSILGYQVGIRPYRLQGIRIESEQIKNKIFIHNYGQGGSGLSLSWGCAQRAVELFQSQFHFPHSTPIAVVGCGVIGLTTAYLLHEAGYQVSIYAPSSPSHTNSYVAPGIWNIFLVEPGTTLQEQACFKQIAKDSYTTFKELAAEPSPLSRGVSPLEIYSFFKTKRNPELLKDDFMGSGISLMAEFDKGFKKEGYLYTTFLIESEIYLTNLFSFLLTKAIPFIQAHFATYYELLGLPEKVIFNCTGMGSQHLFADSSLTPVRGHIVYLKRPPHFNYMVCGGANAEGIDLYLIPLRDKIALGGNYEFNNNDPIPDPLICRKILERAQSFFEGLS